MNELQYIGTLGLPGRYMTWEMGQLWSDTTKIHTWTLVERAAVAALAERLGTRPGAEAVLARAMRPSPAELAEEERATRHDVQAFLNVWRRKIRSVADPRDTGEVAAGEMAANAVHWGLTSSDLVDSANAVRWQTAAELVAREGRLLTRALARRALEERDTRRIGRTHGQWAEEAGFGHWLADRALAVERCTERVARASLAVGRVKLSGPVGDYKRTTRAEEVEFARMLRAGTGTEVEAADSSTQVVARDGLVELAQAIAALCASVASVAQEVRLGAQSEIQELAEPFGQDQVGSSSMPHKRNPVVAEQLTGLYRVVRDCSGSLMDGMVLWGERDISHSSVERVMVPQVTGLGHHVVRRGLWLVEGMEVDQGRMAANLERARPQLQSAAAMSWLLKEGVEPGLARDLVVWTLRAVEDEGGTLAAGLPVVARRWLRQNPEAGGSARLAETNWVGLGQKLEGLSRSGDDRWLMELMEEKAE